MEIQSKDLEQLYEGTFRGIDVGSIMKGTVISRRPDSIVVDIGYKSEGFISIEEFTEEELEQLNEGDDMDVFVLKIRDSEGTLILSKKKANLIKAQQIIRESFNEETPVEGKITEKTKGGYFIDLSGMKAFLPASQFDIKQIKASEEIIGKTYQFKILKLNDKLSNIIVSRRVLIEEERKKLKEETLGKLKEGELISGIVKNIMNYGVFIDLGGIDGLLHISDISWGRIHHPSDIFSVGDEVEVVVLKFDPETEKVTLGYKQKKSDPWLNIEEKYSEGKRVEGKVVSLTDYGAFIELQEGIEGLVHISELDWNTKFKHPSKYLEIGDIVDSVVLKIDKTERRISLGIKQLKPKPWQVVANKYTEGQKVMVKVKTLTDFGVFVGMPEGVDALIHISDISWTKHIKHPSEVLRPGQKIDALVLNLEPEKERMALGIKQLEEDPWLHDIPERFHLGDVVHCKVLRMSEHGIFVDIEDSVEGLIYESEVNKSEDREYHEGDELDARIIRLDSDQRKIGLTMEAGTAQSEG